MNSPCGCCTTARAGLAALSMAVSSAAFGQAYPSRPIEVTVHTSGGSGGDVLSRAVTEIVRREKFLPQPMQVVNRVGGAGALAFNYFKGKRGDPYHLMSVTGTIFAMAYRPDINIGLENYTPVALMAVDPQTIMVPANSPYKTARDLMEAARKAPETLVAATTSVQGTGRLLVYLLEQAAPGAKFRFVTFKGGSEAINSTAGGHTAFTTENLSEGIGFVEARTLRVLAVSSEKRLPHAPDVPTLQELGYPIVAGTIRGFTFAAGVPKEAVATMEHALGQVHNSAGWKDLAKRNLYEDIFLGSAEFTKYLAVRFKEYSGFYDVVLKTKNVENK